jgi:hypothetical protein
MWIPGWSDRPLRSSRMSGRDRPTEFLRHFSDIALLLSQVGRRVAAVSFLWAIGGFGFDHLDLYLVTHPKTSSLNPTHMLFLRANKPTDRQG